MTKFPPASPSLFNGESHIPFGIYDGLIKNTSTASWDKQSGLFSARRTSRKAWIFFGVYSPEFIGGLAIADAGFFTNAFVYYYSLSDGIFSQDSTLIPLGFARDFDPNLDSEWKVGNYRIHTANGKMHFQYSGKFAMNITATLNEFGFSTVVKSEPGRPFNFAYKNVFLPIDAKVENNGKTLESNGNYGAIDYTKGYPPRKSIWNWCSFIGKTESGKSIGLNLVKHFNDEMENILWIDHRKISLGPSFFHLLSQLTKTPGK